MKKTIAMILATVTLAMLCACGSSDPVASKSDVSASGAASNETVVTEKFEGPVLLISVGESADISIAKSVMTKTGVEFTEYTEGADLTGFKSAVLVPGVSVKGLGAAGIDVAAEVAKTEAMLAELDAAGLDIIVAHLGGSSRRDELTDQFLDVVLPAADYICALEEGNKDGKFSDFAAANSVPSTMAGGLADVVNTFKGLYTAE